MTVVRVCFLGETLQIVAGIFVIGNGTLYYFTYTFRFLECNTTMLGREEYKKIFGSDRHGVEARA
jgi:hypothetical protein